MRFICQIAIDEKIFPNSKGKMAYIFMTDDEDEFVDGTWDPESSENAVIIQPGNTEVKVVENTLGTTIEAEFNVQLTFANDPGFIPEAELWDLPEENCKIYYDSTCGSKIDGTPNFIQGDEFPEGEEDWILLAQLDSEQLPFYLNLGDCGTAYIFIDKEGKKGKFLFQCY